MAVKRNTPEGNHAMLVQAEAQNGLTSHSLHEQLRELTNGTFVHNDLISKGPWVRCSIATWS